MTLLLASRTARVTRGPWHLLRLGAQEAWNLSLCIIVQPMSYDAAELGGSQLISARCGAAAAAAAQLVSDNEMKQRKLTNNDASTLCLLPFVRLAMMCKTVHNLIE